MSTCKVNINSCLILVSRHYIKQGHYLPRCNESSRTAMAVELSCPFFVCSFFALSQYNLPYVTHLDANSGLTIELWEVFVFFLHLTFIYLNSNSIRLCWCHVSRRTSHCIHGRCQLRRHSFRSCIRPRAYKLSKAASFLSSKEQSAKWAWEMLYTLIWWRSIQALSSCHVRPFYSHAVEVRVSEDVMQAETCVWVWTWALQADQIMFRKVRCCSAHPIDSCVAC